MQKKICGMLMTAFFIGVPAYGRDFEECVVSTGQNEGFMYNDGNQDRCCLTDRTTCTDINISHFSCAGFFNMLDSVWHGYTGLGHTFNQTGCYINVPAGKQISDTYDLFDESRMYDDLIIDCQSGYYCPGMQLTYKEIKEEYWGTTLAGAIACPDAPSVFVNSSLNETATVANGYVVSNDGASAITDCYLRSGTYYDDTGTYEILGDCNYKE